MGVKFYQDCLDLFSVTANPNFCNFLAKTFELNITKYMGEFLVIWCD